MATEGKPGDVRALVWASGSVQGVCLRAHAEDEAAFQAVIGWIRNAPDGRVEAVFEGPRPSANPMIRWCHRGSPASRVTGVEVAWEAPRGARVFRTRY